MDTYATDRDTVTLLDRPGEVLRRAGASVGVLTSPLGADPVFLHSRPSGVEVARRVRDLVQSGASLELDRSLIDRPAPRASWPEGHASYVRDLTVVPAGRALQVVNGRIAENRDITSWHAEPALTPQRLIALLQAGLQPAAEAGSVRVLMSGGLDSSLLAAVLHNMGVPFTGIVLEDQGCRDDVESAKALAAELGVELEVASIPYPRFLRLIARGVATYEDLRPDAFCAAGLLEIAERSQGVDLLVGGEPADAILGGLRTYTETVDDAARDKVRLVALEHQAPRDVFLLRRAAEAQGIAALSPYAYGPLVRAAVGTPWRHLLDVRHMLLPDRRLGGAGYKLLQRGAAEQLGYSSLRALAHRPKAGLPSSTLTSWERVKCHTNANADNNLAPLWQVGATLFERVVLEMANPDDVDVDELLRRIATQQRASSASSRATHWDRTVPSSEERT